MTTREALQLARREKYHPVPPFMIEKDEKHYPMPSVEEGIRVLEASVESCWFNWMTGKEALETLKKL